MTRVVANLCWLVPGGIGGSEEYTVRLLRAVSEFESGVAVALAGPRTLESAYPDLVSAYPTRTYGGPARLRPYRLAVESTWLPRGTGAGDVVHHFGGRLPARRAGRPVLTIHDLQPLDLPQHFSAVKRAYLTAALPRSIRGATLVTTVSEWVAARVLERFDLPEDRLRVVPSTWDTTARRDPEDAVVASLGDGPVVLYPAATHPHKNHTMLVQAARVLADRHPGLQLVLTGGSGRAEADVRRRIAEVGPPLRVVRTGRAAASTIVSLFHRADVVAFPSTYEGFGLPALEAMRMGTPVVAAAATALPEVLGSAAVLVPPGDVDGWVDALDAVLGDAALASRMVADGRRRAEVYAPDKAAERLVSVWRDAAD